MYIKDGKRFNPHGRVEFNGFVYEGNVLAFPDVVEALGIEEIEELKAPKDFSDATYFRTYQDIAPYVVYEKRPAEQIRQFQLASIPAVSPWQIRKALNALGLRDAVEKAVAASDITTQDAWNHATEFRRDDVLVEGVGKALNKSDEELDNLFILAGTL